MKSYVQEVFPAGFLPEEEVVKHMYPIDKLFFFLSSHYVHSVAEITEASGRQILPGVPLTFKKRGRDIGQ